MSSASAGNTTCPGTELDWYINDVGETPCTTYQRLRQICNPSYLVPDFRSQTPGDNCDDQVSDCCCNSISWALSMLCMNCQQDTATQNAPNGIDAGATAYFLYRDGDTGACKHGTNQSLPTNVQSAVCNQDIKIMNTLYSLFWGDGSCTYTKEASSEAYASNSTSVFGYCVNEISSSVSSSVTASLKASSTTAFSSSQGLPTLSGLSSATAQSSTNNVNSGHSSLSDGAIAGIAIGAIAAVILLLLGTFCLLRHRRRSFNVDSLSGENPAGPTAFVPTPFTSTPFMLETGPRSEPRRGLSGTEAAARGTFRRAVGQAPSTGSTSYLNTSYASDSNHSPVEAISFISGTEFRSQRTLAYAREGPQQTIVSEAPRGATDQASSADISSYANASARSESNYEAVGEDAGVILSAADLSGFESSSSRHKLPPPSYNAIYRGVS